MQRVKTPFFITGLPRTRSAWLANLFCTDTTVCFHEPLESVTGLIAAYPWLRVGVADSTLPLKFGALRDKWPEARWLYVKRDPGEAMRSFIRFTRTHVKLLHRQLQQFWQMHRQASEAIYRAAQGDGSAAGHVLVVEYEGLSDPATIAAAWEHLLPGLPLNAARLAALQGLKIEQRIETRVSELGERLGSRLVERKELHAG